MIDNPSPLDFLAHCVSKLSFDETMTLARELSDKASINFADEGGSYVEWAHTLSEWSKDRCKKNPPKTVQYREYDR